MNDYWTLEVSKWRKHTGLTQTLAWHLAHQVARQFHVDTVTQTITVLVPRPNTLDDDGND